MKKHKIYIVSFLTIALAVVGLNLVIFLTNRDNVGFEESLVITQNDKGWIYEIYVDEKLLIKQETIPAISGECYFENKGDAEKIGYLVLDKLKNGVVPPTVSFQEIMSSNIIISN